MKNVSKFILGIILIWLWNYFPYSYSCYEYPLVGCSETVFWWDLPTDWKEYRGIKWQSYFFANTFISLIIIVIFKKIKNSIKNTN
ncbi:hypothetical protein AO498_07085 [Algoriphagus sanaruensis]|uniref:Uncharacterized protein n=1 Tax=Algoriphagus sanaruensis TaxID=1727163 RepID=A0A142EM18_9BACT|nr:hypothetical protein AO498_07085 [Algoriphagus sanaruensis]